MVKLTTKSILVKPSIDKYKTWLEVNHWNPNKVKYYSDLLKTLAYQPLISIIIPVFNTDCTILTETLQSVFQQVYTNWEICICNDCSTDQQTLKVLQEYEKCPNINITKTQENSGISVATNIAVSTAKGEYIVFLDHDDLLTVDALIEVVIYLNKNKYDILYSDDDKISVTGERYMPQFKPDWNPELLLSYMYLGHLKCIKRSLFLENEGFKKEFDGSQDYEFFLRVTEKTDNIGHIPKILYHWRAVQGSTALDGQCKPESFEAGKRALEEALKRRGIRSEVKRPIWAVQWNCGYYEILFPHTGPDVTIVIPTKNQHKMLSKCISSIIQHTYYKNYDILVVDNDSTEQSTLEFIQNISYKSINVKNSRIRFNYSQLMNTAVKEVSTPYLLFLNNDVEVINPEWLSQMMGYAQLENVGVVGARLLFPNETIQHAGLVHGYLDGGCAPGLKLIKSNSGTYMAFERLSRDCTAVTGACLLTKTSLYLEFGGLDEEEFSIGYNDPDLCHRLEEKGYRTVYCASAKLYHYENFSRGVGTKDDVLELHYYKAKYKKYVDKHYNVNLSLDDPSYQFSSRVVLSKDILNPVKTLMFTYNLNLEGSSFSQFELTTGLKEKGVIDPVVYCFQEGPLRKMYEEEGIEVHVFPSPLNPVFNINRYMKGLEELSTFIQKIGAELIYANTLQMFYGIDVAKQLNLPSIWNVRESEPIYTYFNHFGFDIAQRALDCFYYPYKVIFVANSTKKGCDVFNAHNNFITIHNGIREERVTCFGDKEEYKKHLKMDKDKLTFLSLGTVCERKNQKELIQAIKLLPHIYLDKVEFFIVGDRPSLYSTELHQMIEGLEEDRKKIIHVIPEVADVSLYYFASDVFVLTTSLESYPRVILEAMVCGLPIITTAVNGIVEQVYENINGRFYQSGRPNELCREIINMITLDSKSIYSSNQKVILKGMDTYHDMLNKYSTIFQEAWISGESR